MGRFKRSFHLMKQSYGVLMQDKELMILPVISGLLILLIVASFVIPIGMSNSDNLDEMEGPLGYALLFLFYVVTYTISFFFQAAIIAGASERMAGGDPTLSSALGAAKQRLGVLLVWGIIAATVGMVIRAIESRSEIVGRIVMGLIGVAWSLATYFMVPVLVMEREPVGKSFKRSWAIFKQTWGETVVGNLGLGLAGFLLALPIVGVCVLLVMAHMEIVALVVGVLGLVSLSVFMSALQGVYVAAVYRFATSGDAPDGFDTATLQAAFRQKRNR